MISKPSGRRFVFEDRKYTPFERLQAWIRLIQQAQAELQEVVRRPPPETYTIQVEVKPDDPRYEHAPIEEVWVAGPSFRFNKKKRKNMNVLPKECQKGNHPWEAVYEDYVSDLVSNVVRWCPSCGAVVVDQDFDGRTNPGAIRKIGGPTYGVKRNPNH
jgi:hypothetical protein